MPHIRQLSDDVIATIAAGEVIQRPDHVIKELIENSVDAQATQITILVEDSGLKKIEIIDDGMGIHPEDLPLALTPHATSKLQKISDFEQIRSHGFRGEALASIAQVSHVTVASRLKSKQAGYVIESKQGTLSEPKPIGMPVGTRVTVTHLFSQTPVRQEFLKQSKTHLRHIVELVTTFGLAYPHIGFTLKHNQRVLLDLIPEQTLIERTQTIHGSESFSQMMPVHYSTDEISLSGFISQPSLWSKRPIKQYLFVNNRPISHAKLQKHIHNLINSVQANNLYPLYNLYITIAPKEIDPNIHPQKTTVELYTLDKIYQAFDQAITQLLKQRPLTYTSVPEINYLIADGSGAYKTHRFRRGLLSEYHQSADQSPKLTGAIQQIANLYLLAPTSDGLLLVDQHALHERILYDQLKTTLKAKRSSLLKDKTEVNVAFDLTPQEKLLLETHSDDLEKLGIEIEPFGQQSYKISSIPTLYADHHLVSLIKEVLHQIATDDQLQVDSQTDALLASMACRLAVKAGDPLDKQTRTMLIESLLSQNHTGTCPHGRPVAIKINLAELDKLFKRT